MDHNTGTDHSCKKVRCIHSCIQDPPQHKNKHDDYNGGSYHTQFFTYDGKDHIIMRLWDKSKFLHALSQTASKYSAGCNGIKALQNLISFFIGFNISPDLKSSGSERITKFYIQSHHGQTSSSQDPVQTLLFTGHDTHTENNGKNNDSGT